MFEQEYTPPAKSNSLALIGLILGIISVLIIILGCCLFPIIGGIIGTIFAIAAFIMGFVARKQIKEQNGSQSQMKLATAALILGIVGFVFGLINMVYGIIVNLVLSGPTIDQIFQDIINQIENH